MTARIMALIHKVSQSRCADLGSGLSMSYSSWFKRQKALWTQAQNYSMKTIDNTLLHFENWMPTHVLQSMNLVSKTIAHCTIMVMFGGHVLKWVLTWSRAPSLLSVWIGTVGGSLYMMRRTGNRGPGGVCTRGVCSNSLSALLLLDCGIRLCPWREEWGVL